MLQKTAHSHIQKEETRKLIRSKLAVGWKLKVTRDIWAETAFRNGTRSHHATRDNQGDPGCFPDKRQAASASCDDSPAAGWWINEASPAG